MYGSDLDSRVDHVAAGIIKGIQQLKAVFLGHGTHYTGPGITNAHGTQLQWTNTNTGRAREDAVATKLRLGLWRGLEHFRHLEC